MFGSSASEVKSNFIKELQDSHAEAKTSLPYIKNTLPDIPLVRTGERFQIIVIGGSVFRSAICKKTDTGIDIIESSYGNKPQFVTRDNFLSFIDTLVQRECTSIAVNFAFPLGPVYKDNVLDGKLLFPTKENKFEGLINKEIGKEIETFLYEKYRKKVRVSVANDTVCTLLSGKNTVVSNTNKLMCGIVGTGVNFAFFENKNRIINLEAGDFNKFTPSKYARKIAKHSQHPEIRAYEREVAGAYLYQHFNHFTNENGLSHKIKSTHELDSYARSCSNSIELCEFTHNLLKHSASYVAAVCAAIAEFKENDMHCIMAGSLFWHGFSFRQTVEESLKELTDKSITFHSIENSEIFGGANLIC